MKKIFTLFAFIIYSSISFSQNITVASNGSICDFMAGTYVRQALDFNGKPSYVYFSPITGTAFLIRFTLDSKWRLYEDAIGVTPNYFYNNSVGLIPPCTGWIAQNPGVSGCTGSNSDIIVSGPGCGGSTLITFIGTTNTLWNVASNWDLNRLPNAYDDVVINNQIVKADNASTLIEINSLTISGTSADLQNGNAPQIKINNGLFWSAGKISESIETLGTASTLTGGLKTYGTSTANVWTNSGTITWSGGDLFLNGNVNNTGFFNMYNSPVFYLMDGNFSSVPTFTNSGTFRHQSNLFNHDIRTIKFLNTGTVECSGPSNLAPYNLDNQGSIVINAGSSFYAFGGNLKTGTVVTGTGTLAIGAAKLDLPLTLTTNKASFSPGNGGTGSLTSSNEVRIGSGSVVSFPLTIMPAGTLIRSGTGTTTISSTVENNGTTTWTNGNIQLSNGIFRNNGMLDINVPNTVSMSQAAGTTNEFTNCGTIKNQATTNINIPLQTCATAGISVITGTGTLQLPSPSVLNVNGFVRPGNSPGELTIDAPITSTADAVYEMEIAGNSADKLSSTGNIGLDGTLKISLSTPTAGDYILFDGLTSSGSFTSVQYSLNGGAFSTTPPTGYSIAYNNAQGTVTLTVAPVTGVTCTWHGNHNTDWFDISNWDTGTIPTSIDDVIIGNVLTTTILANMPINIKSLTITKKITLTGSAGATLTTGSITHNVVSNGDVLSTITGFTNVTVSTITLNGLARDNALYLTVQNATINDVVNMNTQDLRLTGTVNLNNGCTFIGNDPGGGVEFNKVTANVNHALIISSSATFDGIFQGTGSITINENNTTYRFGLDAAPNVINVPLTINLPPTTYSEYIIMRKVVFEKDVTLNAAYQHPDINAETFVIYSRETTQLLPLEFKAKLTCNRTFFIEGNSSENFVKFTNATLDLTTANTKMNIMATTSVNNSTFNGHLNIYVNANISGSTFNNDLELGSIYYSSPFDPFYTFTFNGTTTVKGILKWTKGIIALSGINSQLLLPLNSTFSINKAIDFSNSTNGTINNLGINTSINICGTLDIQTPATIGVPVIFCNSGKMQGVGSIVFLAPCTLNGIVAPNHSPGILNINNPLVASTPITTTFEMEITGGYDDPATPFDDQDNDQLTTNGNLLLAGNLKLILTNPVVGNYTIFNSTGGSVLGFNSLLVTYSVNGGAFTATTPPNITIQVTPNSIVVIVTGSVLPVELLTFKAQNTEGGNLLTWQTASEVNTSNFDIERSFDGQIFEKIGNIKAEGKAASYNYIDKYPLSTTNYYRLKINDLDGKTDYSKVITLSQKAHGLTAKAYPNPAKDVLTVAIEVETKSDVTIELKDILGRTIWQSKAENTEGSLSLPIPLTDIANGTYFLKVSNGLTTIQQKIVKN
jgi:hypothetical protein